MFRIFACEIELIRNEMNILELSEQEIIRRKSLEELRAMGIEPYPADEYITNAYSTDTYLSNISFFSVTFTTLAIINEKKEVVFKVDSAKVVKVTEKKDIFDK